MIFFPIFFQVHFTKWSTIQYSVHRTLQNLYNHYWSRSFQSFIKIMLLFMYCHYFRPSPFLYFFKPSYFNKKTYWWHKTKTKACKIWCKTEPVQFSLEFKNWKVQISKIQHAKCLVSNSMPTASLVLNWKTKHIPMYLIWTKSLCSKMKGDWSYNKAAGHLLYTLFVNLFLLFLFLTVHHIVWLCLFWFQGVKITTLIFFF